MQFFTPTSIFALLSIIVTSTSAPTRSFEIIPTILPHPKPLFQRPGPKLFYQADVAQDASSASHQIQPPHVYDEFQLWLEPKTFFDIKGVKNQLMPQMVNLPGIKALGLMKTPDADGYMCVVGYVKIGKAPEVAERLTHLFPNFLRNIDVNREGRYVRFAHTKLEVFI